MRHLILLICCGVTLFFASSGIANEFPYREYYPEVTTVELDELKSGYDRGEIVIVDVRTKTEFETIHIKNALNVPYNHAHFARYLDKIAQKDLNKIIILYDNGIDSVKAYRAADEAFLGARILNVNVYDAGIAAWAEAYPNDTIVQGTELKNPGKQLLAEDKFSNKQLDFNTFKRKAANSNAVAIDLRDPLEREGKLPGFEEAYIIPADKLVKNIIRKGHMKDKQLFIFDQDGRRVQWIMYYLVDHDYTNYYFLNGGATAVLNGQDYNVSFNR